MDLETLYNKNIELLKQLKIPFKEYDHEPILDYNTAEKVKQKFQWTGKESKNLFLKSKDNKNFFLLLTIEGKKADFDKLRAILKTRVSLASPEELKEKTGCIPGCATPFGNDKEITIIFDKSILDHEKWIYSPGFPEKSIELETRYIEKILEQLDNQIIRI